MQYLSTDLLLSATDLSNFLGCRHRTSLEMDAAAHIRTKPHHTDPLLELLFARGLAHEKAYVEQLRAEGREITDLSATPDGPQRVAATLAAMRAGADVIVQGALRHGSLGWQTRHPLPRLSAERLRQLTPTKSPTPSSRKKPAPARSSNSASTPSYSLKRKNERPNTSMSITPNPEHHKHTFRVNDYSAYVRLVRDQLLSTVALTSTEIFAQYYPEPVELCHICPWTGLCIQKRIDDDDLSLVANITRTQRRELDARGTTHTHRSRPTPTPSRVQARSRLRRLLHPRARASAPPTRLARQESSAARAPRHRRRTRTLPPSRALTRRCLPRPRGRQHRLRRRTRISVRARHSRR